MPVPKGGSASILTRDVIVLGSCWGASVVLQRIAVAEIQPLWLVALRLVAALAFFLPFLPRIRRVLDKNPRSLLDIGVVGALNPVGSALFSALALQFASSGLVALFVSLGPLFAALMAEVLPGKSRLGRGQLAGLIGAFGGVALLVTTRSTGLGAAVPADLRGYALALAVALSLALSSVYADRRLEVTDPLAIASGQIAAGLLLVLLLLPFMGGRVAPATFSAQAWLAVVLSGALGLGGSFVLLASMVKRHGPTAALVALYVTPLAAAGLGVVLLGESVTFPMAAGGALILGGVFLFTHQWTVAV
jgi:drug/metabolite transporter (DMT)-like permease